MAPALFAGFTSSGGVSSVTVTFSCSTSIASGTFSRVGCPEVITTLSFSYTVNPGAMMFRVYLPGGTELNSYWPCPSAFPLIGVAEAPAGTSTTLGFAIAAPEGSVTCPRKDPEGGGAVWPTATAAHRDSQKVITAK